MPLPSPSPRPSPIGERVYRLSTGWRLSFLAACLLLVAVGLALAAWPLVRRDGPPLGFAVGAGAFAAVFAWAGVQVGRMRVVLGQDAVALEEPPFISRRLRRQEILGRRRLELQHGMSQLVLVPRGAGLKPIKISSIYRTDAAFDAWVAELPDLDLQERHEEEAALQAALDARGQGGDLDAALRGPRLAARLLTVLAFAVSAWVFFWPRPYVAAVACAFALPLVAVAATALWRGQLVLDERRNDPRPNVGLAFMMPGIVLGLRAIMDVNLLAEGGLALAGVGAGAALAIAAALADPTLRWRWWAPLLVAGLASFWGYGAVAEADVLLDRAPPALHGATVRSKRVGSGKDHRRLLDLGPWGPVTRGTEASVPAEDYARVEPGQQVEVELHPGALGAPWYVVRVP